MMSLCGIHSPVLICYALCYKKFLNHDLNFLEVIKSADFIKYYNLKVPAEFKMQIQRFVEAGRAGSNKQERIEFLMKALDRCDEVLTR